MLVQALGKVHTPSPHFRPAPDQKVYNPTKIYEEKVYEEKLAPGTTKVHQPSPTKITRPEYMFPTYY